MVVDVSDWFDGGGAGQTLDVLALLDSGVSDLLHAVVGFGALLSLGLTSDGGALGVTVTLDGRWRREYFREVEPMMEWLAGALKALEAAGPRPTASSAPRSRQRRSRDR